MKILYDGIGCNKIGEHTETEFLNIMSREFTHKIWKYELEIISRENHYQLQFKDWSLPDDFTPLNFLNGTKSTQKKQSWDFSFPCKVCL